MNLNIKLKEGDDLDISSDYLKLRDVKFSVRKGIQKHLTPAGDKKLIVLGKRGERFVVNAYLRDDFKFGGLFGFKRLNDILKAEKIENITFFPPETGDNLTIFSVIKSFYTRIVTGNNAFTSVSTKVTSILLEPEHVSISDSTDSNMKILTISGFINNLN